MAPHTGKRSLPARAAILVGMIAALACLAGCGSGRGDPALAGPPKSCPATVLDTLSRVVRRIYHEGVASERTAVARHAIAASAQLRTAVEAGDPAAVRAAAQALVTGGRMTNLRVMRGGTVLADVGGPALAPFSGTITGAGGTPIATYLTSVWSDEGFLAESEGVAEGRVALRVGGRSVGGSQALPAGDRRPEARVRAGLPPAR